MKDLAFALPLILTTIVYGLVIVALVYFIWALRIYIKKNS